MVLLGSAAMVGTLYFVTRPPIISEDAASERISHCIKAWTESCLRQKGLSPNVLSRAKFSLSKVTNDPRYVVANYEFVSDDDQFCVFVEFGRGDLSYVRTAHFYRCRERNSVHLGIG